MAAIETPALPAADHEAERVADALVGRIPVRNIWWLLLYASYVDDAILKNIAADQTAAIEDNPDDIPDLVAQILARQTEQRIRRHLNADYIARAEVLSRVRGRIDIFRTHRHQLLQRGKVACRFEEMTINTPRNCYVRAALQKIAPLANKAIVARQCRALAGRLHTMGITGACPQQSSAAIGRFARHDADDKPMVHAARLAHELALPSELAGASRLPAPIKEKNVVERVYEKALAGFYAYALSDHGWKINRGTHLHWQQAEASAGMATLLPRMEADIILDSPSLGRRIVIDAKFTEISKSNQFGGEKFKSGYIYQIYAYLRSQERSDDPRANSATGILLHPAIGAKDDDNVTEHATIQNHKLLFATVNLTAPAPAIKARLLQIIKIACS